MVIAIPVLASHHPATGLELVILAVMWLAIIGAAWRNRP